MAKPINVCTGFRYHSYRPSPCLHPVLGSLPRACPSLAIKLVHRQFIPLSVANAVSSSSKRRTPLPLLVLSSAFSFAFCNGLVKHVADAVTRCVIVGLAVAPFAQSEMAVAAESGEVKSLVDSLTLTFADATANEPPNALSIPTWAIHVASVVEWVAAMVLVWQYGEIQGNEGWKGLSWGMVPLLAGAMCACTWHFYYNAESLEVLVVVQSVLTLIGNFTIWIAAFRIYQKAQEKTKKI